MKLACGGLGFGGRVGVERLREISLHRSEKSKHRESGIRQQPTYTGGVQLLHDSDPGGLRITQRWNIQLCFVIV